MLKLSVTTLRANVIPPVLLDQSNCVSDLHFTAPGFIAVLPVRAKRVLDPDDAVSAVGQAFQGEDVETHATRLPVRPPLKEVASGADDLALLAPGDGARRAAEIGTDSLANFDYREYRALHADQIELADFAAQVAFEHDEATRLEVLRRELFGGDGALQV